MGYGCECCYAYGLFFADKDRGHSSPGHISWGGVTWADQLSSSGV